MSGNTDKAYLILANGRVFEGRFFGHCGEAVGEIVFSTGMGGYLETLTDPSFYGQFILQTFPLIGNYGVIPDDFESEKVAAKAYIVKHPCDTPSNFRSKGTLCDYLQEQGVIGLYGIDTRELTRIIRDCGVMGAKITTHPPTEKDFTEIKDYAVTGAVAKVSPREITQYSADAAAYRIALIDYGAKHGIRKALTARGCSVTSFPYDTPADEILNTDPHGVMLSNGPGDPADAVNAACVRSLAELHEKRPYLPIFGICLGHQLLAMAHGYKTKKLKFGHRGANQPCKDLRTGRVYITSQNHGYTVIADSANKRGTLSFINVNDGTCEGLDYGVSFSVQFHPEARGGPLDTAFLFDEFIRRIGENYAT